MEKDIEPAKKYIVATNKWLFCGLSFCFVK